jgi:hypothetical protein
MRKGFKKLPTQSLHGNCFYAFLVAFIFDKLFQGTFIESFLTLENFEMIGRSLAKGFFDSYRCFLDQNTDLSVTIESNEPSFFFYRKFTQLLI